MRQIVYVSTSAWKLGEKDIEAILTSARRNNPALGVTGMLLCVDFGFLQILEGPAQGVEKIYARILQDKRHAAQRILLDEEVEDRLFAHWSMGYDKPGGKLASRSGLFTATRKAVEAAVPLAKAVATARLVRNFYALNAVDEPV